MMNNFHNVYFLKVINESFQSDVGQKEIHIQCFNAVYGKESINVCNIGISSNKKEVFFKASCVYLEARSVFLERERERERSESRQTSLT